DYLAEGLYSEANALAIRERSRDLCRGRLDRVRLDPAATARSGLGPAAFGEFARAFGERITAYWPVHRVLDGLDQIEVLVGGPGKEPDLLIHPRATRLVEAFNTYVREQRAGEWLGYAAAEQHPAEDLMDALRGGIRDALPEGRAPQPVLRRTHVCATI